MATVGTGNTSSILSQLSSGTPGNFYLASGRRRSVSWVPPLKHPLILQWSSYPQTIDEYVLNMRETSNRTMHLDRMMYCPLVEL